MATSQAPTATEYIVHHLTHLSTGKQKFIVDFSVINVDTVVFSLACLGLTLFLLHRAARAATTGVPGRFQAFVEMIVEMVEEQSKFPAIAGWFGIHYLRPLPTADLNGTLGMSIGVLLLMIYYAVKIKGFGGWVHELFTAPFGANPLLWPFNFLLNLIEYFAKTVSLGMRLFGNMYAGELLFFLIALLGGTWAFRTDSSLLLALGHVLAGTGWLLFHILIVLLQAFIFMMLTLVYIGQAHEGH